MENNAAQCTNYLKEINILLAQAMWPGFLTIIVTGFFTKHAAFTHCSTLLVLTLYHLHQCYSHKVLWTPSLSSLMLSSSLSMFCISIATTWASSCNGEHVIKWQTETHFWQPIHQGNKAAHSTHDHTNASIRTLAPSSLSVSVSTSVISCSRSTTAMAMSAREDCTVWGSKTQCFMVSEGLLPTPATLFH